MANDIDDKNVKSGKTKAASRKTRAAKGGAKRTATATKNATAKRTAKRTPAKGGAKRAAAAKGVAKRVGAKSVRAKVVSAKRATAKRASAKKVSAKRMPAKPAFSSRGEIVRGALAAFTSGGGAAARPSVVAEWQAEPPAKGGAGKAGKVGSLKVDTRVAVAARPKPLGAAERAGAKLFLETLFAPLGEEVLATRDRHALIAASAYAFDRLRTCAAPLVVGFSLPASLPELPARRFLLCIGADRPFLVDGAHAALSRADIESRILVHPIFSIARDAKGRLRTLERARPSARADKGFANESVLFLELTPGDSADNLALLVREAAASNLALGAAVADWQAMRTLCAQTAERLEKAAAGAAGKARGGLREIAEEAAFLRWLVEDHFIFLGARDTATRLGMFAVGEGGGSRGAASAALTALTVAKAGEGGRLRRDGPLDVIRVPVPAGGEVHFVGYFTSKLAHLDPQTVPLLRGRLDRIFGRARCDLSAHSGKALRRLLDAWPREALLHLEPEAAASLASEIEQLQEQPRTRIFLHRDKREALWHIVLCLPRHNLSDAVLARLQHLLAERLGGRALALRVVYDDSPLGRIHGVFLGEEKAIARDSLESEIDALTRSPAEQLLHELTAAYGEDEGVRLLRRWRNRLHPEYQSAYAIRLVAEELPWFDAALCSGEARARLVWLGADTGAGGGFAEGPADAGTLAGALAADDTNAALAKSELRLSLRFIVPGTKQLLLSDTLAILERMGFRVRGENAVFFEGGGLEPCWFHDLDLLVEHSDKLTPERRATVAAAFLDILQGRVEDDRFNALTLVAGIPSARVVILRALARHLLQSRLPWSAAAVASALCAHPKFARGLVELFWTRHENAEGESTEGNQAARTRRGDALGAELTRSLEAVADPEHDRILRTLLRLEEAVLRTNYWQIEADKNPGGTLAFKLDSSSLAHLPAPRPYREIFVTSKDVEGVHLRFGSVARGGLRWSDRREDFRDEILGLAKAQEVKNAVIVPLGAKGGFVLRNPPADRGEFHKAGVVAYRAFITALLQITDNRDGRGGIAHPERVVRRDKPDPYLVVAADKGTAAFSDIANEIALSRGFWLGDAFASGGSAGYNHKTMGITARGAWESLRRHFRAFGKNPDTDAFTAVGCGDMSGDVFGNGMMLAKNMILVAAFNHRWIFIDPEADAKIQTAERKRLFKNGQDWEHFNRKLLSRGGAVLPRTAKSVTLSAPAAAALDLAPGKHAPDVVVRAVLCARADLLWFGGIGTYIRGRGEADSEVGDRANDAVRIAGREVRAAVVIEGANLGLTSEGRIEYAQNGGRINTDFIDNSAGVDCSDHEVNLKILLADAIRNKQLAPSARNRLLASMEDEIGGRVLRHNFLQVQSLSVMHSIGARLNDRLRHVIRNLERHHGLDRALAGLPGAEEFEDRGRRGIGLSQPELATLLALTKNALTQELVDTELLDDPALGVVLEAYFPERLRTRFAGEIADHPLRRELLCTLLANRVCDRMGVAFVSEVTERTNTQAQDVVRAWLIVVRLFGLEDLWRRGEALPPAPKPPLPDERIFIEVARFAELASVWLLRNETGRGRSIDAVVSDLQDGVQRLQKVGVAVLPPAAAKAFAARRDELLALRIERDTAERVAFLRFSTAVCGIVRASGKGDACAEARLFYAVGENFGFDWLRAATDKIPRANLWDKLAIQSLLEDANTNQILLTRAVGARAADKGTEAIDRWRKRNPNAVAAAEEVLEELRLEAEPRLAMLILAGRRLKALADFAAGD